MDGVKSKAKFDKNLLILKFTFINKSKINPKIIADL